MLRGEIEAVASGRIEYGPGQRTVAQINMALLDWIDGAPSQGKGWLALAEADLDAYESLPRRTYADLAAAYIAFSSGEPLEAIARIERLGERLAGLGGGLGGLAMARVRVHGVRLAAVAAAADDSAPKRGRRSISQ